MSLVNDALRKARHEAARQEADRSGAILPTLGQVRQEPEKPIRHWASIFAAMLITGLAAVVAVVLLGGESEVPGAPQAAVGAHPDAQSEADSQIGSVQRSIDESPPRAAAPSSPATDSAKEDSPSASGEGATRVAAAASSEAEGLPANRDTALDTQSADPRSTPRAGREAPDEEVTSLSTSATGAVRQPTPDSRAPAPGNSATTEDSLASGPAVRATATSDRSSGPETAGTTPSESRPPAASRESASSPPVPPDAAPQGAPDPVESFVRQATLQGIGTFSLDGIAWSSDRPFALVNGEVVGPGGSISGATVVEVTRDSVVLERDGRRFRLTLR